MSRWFEKGTTHGGLHRSDVLAWALAAAMAETLPGPADEHVGAAWRSLSSLRV
jgi:hypothetical protein